MSAPEVAVRDAAPPDVAAIGRVHVAAWRAAYAGTMGAPFLASLDAGESAAAWAKRLDQKAQVLVALADGALVGFACYGAARDDDVAPGTGELMAINLHPDAWRRGVGSRLLAAVAERLRAAGFREALLWVVRENVRARRFYEQHGWRPDGSEKNDGGQTGPVVYEVRYRSAL